MLYMVLQKCILWNKYFVNNTKAYKCYEKNIDKKKKIRVNIAYYNTYRRYEDSILLQKCT